MLYAVQALLNNTRLERQNLGVEQSCCFAEVYGLFYACIQLYGTKDYDTEVALYIFLWV